MVARRVADWDDAYANGIHIAAGERWPEAWVRPAADYRAELGAEGRARLDLAYGPAARNRFDLFLPAGAPQGLVVFVHGGYWMGLDKSFWSHLARGANERGRAVAVPSYTLCPDIRIGGIGHEVAAAIATAAGMVAGPIALTGHSAGGQLVTRMGCLASPLASDVQARLGTIVSISGVHDLRPLLRTGMNATLRLDADECARESPALLAPMPRISLTTWVGAGERAEFVRQSALLANIWTGLGATTRFVAEPDRHHFDVVDGLTDPSHPIMEALLRER